uniref:Uncharacterized protein n=1 Tax=Aegilops tauschii subsp. strangulata TaxID=200361 RepID=A0A453NWN3_AEGTS
MLLKNNTEVSNKSSGGMPLFVWHSSSLESLCQSPCRSLTILYLLSCWQKYIPDVGYSLARLQCSLSIPTGANNIRKKGGFGGTE